MKKTKTKTPEIVINWVCTKVVLNDSVIEMDMNYETRQYYMSSGTEDRNVSFKSDDGGSIDKHLDRAKCVIAALEYIKKEFNL